MAGPAPNARIVPPRPSLGQTFKRAAIGLVFAAILLIPRLRRLRRNVLVWTVVRVVAAGVAAWLLAEFARGGAGTDALAGGIILAIFAALFGARPEKKTLDALSRELHALVMLNGGVFENAGAGGAGERVNLFVLADRVLALTPDERQLADVPLAAIRSASAHPAPSTGKRNRSEDWELDLSWELSGVQSACFRFRGAFAEHLARVAERTLTSMWKRGLPVLPAI